MKHPVVSLPAVFRGAPISKKDLLALSAGERLASMSDIFLFPSVVGDVLKELQYAYASSGVAGLSSNLLLSGPDATGKTRLIRHFWSKHLPSNANGSTSSRLSSRHRLRASTHSDSPKPSWAMPAGRSL